MTAWDALTAQRGSLFEKVLGQVRWIKHRLGSAFTVADIYENDAAQVAPGMDPAGKRDRLADMRRAQFIAMMRSFHGCCRIQDLAGSPE